MWYLNWKINDKNEIIRGRFEIRGFSKILEENKVGMLKDKEISVDGV